MSVHYREGAQKPEERMVLPMAVSQSLSSATPVLAQWAHLLSGYNGKDGGYAWAQQYRLPLTKADLFIAFAKCLKIQ